MSCHHSFAIQFLDTGSIARKHRILLAQVNVLLAYKLKFMIILLCIYYVCINMFIRVIREMQ